MSLQSQLKKPITWFAIGAALMAWYSWRPGWLGRALAKQNSDFYRNLRTQRKYKVTLKSGKVVTMTNVQLADALDASAVRDYKQIEE